MGFGGVCKGGPLDGKLYSHWATHFQTAEQSMIPDHFDTGMIPMSACEIRVGTYWWTECDEHGAPVPGYWRYS